ncbi:MAG TPA: hypothetical protein VGB13_08505 [Candidatus Krumholzibacteria bacterium]
MGRNLTSAVCFIVICACVAGCLLEPRKPEGGGGAACFVALPATSDFGEVFTNLDGSLECLEQSTYLDFIHPDFEFIPSATAESSFPSVFDEPWGVSQEQQWLNVLFADTDSLISDLRLRDIQVNVAGDQATVEASYRLRHVPRGGGAIVYRGQGLYTLEVSGTKWVLRSWDDRDTGGGDSALGNLRGGLLQ